jgi:hypothetical protein
MLHFQEAARNKEEELRKWSVNMGAGWRPPKKTTFGIPSYLLEKIQ